jgi:hypothetical protein
MKLLWCGWHEWAVSLLLVYFVFIKEFDPTAMRQATLAA